MRKSIRVAAASVLVLALFGCGSEVIAPTLASITLSSTASVVTVGSTIQVEATLLDTQGGTLERDITWTAAGPQVQVTGSGKTVQVLGVSAGTTSVRAEADGVSSQPLNITVQNLPASVTSLSPSSTTVGSGNLTLTVTGTGFASGAVVTWNGLDRTTTPGSATQLTASIPASDLAAAGTVQVAVRNPAPGGGAANSLTFTINNPTPQITSVSPSTVTAGSEAFTLTVTGTGFVAGARVRWNGAERTTTFVSSTSVTASIPATDVAAAGTGAITVANPGPVAAVSNTINFTIRAPAPDLTITALTAPQGGQIGTNIAIQTTIANQGTAAAGAFRILYYYSTDATITSSDTFSGGGCTYSGLQAGATISCQGNASVPSSLSPGSYFFGAIVDADGLVTESNETNNTRATPITLTTTAPAPDLVVTSVTAPSSGVQGGTLFVTITYTNSGTVNAGAFRVGIWYSNDTTINTFDEFSGFACSPSNLAVGASGTCSGTITIRSSLSPGTYYVGGFADDLRQITESDETNNARASAPITITASLDHDSAAGGTRR
jgi:hypothetical protein